MDMLIAPSDSRSTFSCRRPVVLSLIGAFWPGHDAAGPNQSLAALARSLLGEFEFKIVARDSSFGSSKSLAPTDKWIEREFASFRYCKVSALGAKGLTDILRSTPYDILLMNGFFDREYSIPALILRRMGRIPVKPAILSTRGEFGEGALNLKSKRKMTYIGLARRLGLLSDVWLHATSEKEAADVAAGFPWSRGVLIAPNISVLPEWKGAAKALNKSDCRLVFLGRVTRVKNLHVALTALRYVKSKVTFDIFGPINDIDYWNECERIIAKLPSHVVVRKMGTILNTEVARTMTSYDLLFLPTAGENYGHAIFEALSCAVPVLISDQTPWRNLEEKSAGWDLPLDEPNKFSATIDYFAKLQWKERNRLAEGARALAVEWVRTSDAISRSRKMLYDVLNGS